MSDLHIVEEHQNYIDEQEPGPSNRYLGGWTESSHSPRSQGSSYQGEFFPVPETTAEYEDTNKAIRYVAV